MCGVDAMRSPAGVGTLVISREGHASDRLWTQLARTLASSDDLAGVAIERHVGSPASFVVARPKALLGSIDPSARRAVVEGRRAPPFSVAPPTGWSECFGAITIGPSRDDRGPRGPEGRPRPPGLPNPMTQGQGMWIATRTYWVPRSEGGLWTARMYRLGVPPAAGRSEPAASAVGAALAQHWSAILGRPCVPQPIGNWAAARAWRSWSTDATPRTAWTPLDPDRAPAATTLPHPAYSVASLEREEGHLSVFGTSGAGKTSFLAELGSDAIRRGQSVVALDLHGDLTTAILARLAPVALERVMAVDLTDRPVPGINILGGASPGQEDRAVAHLVAALKRLTPDGEAIYWGFRLERIFDSFIRLVQEEGGSLVDLAGALQSPSRREALRVGTRRPELARFLDELAPVLQRQPDFLWPAASRLSKVVLVPAVRELLAPEGAELPWEEGLACGRSLLVRLPFAEIGSEAASLASTLLLGRIYLAHAAAGRDGGVRRPLLLLLDEAQGFSPRLLTEILSEGRKFGVRAVVATQYPERLAPELDHALRGAVGTHVCFRVPPSSGQKAAEWLGIERIVPPEHLTSLPTGTALRVGRGVDPLTVPAPPAASGMDAWREAVRRTRGESDLEPREIAQGASGAGVDEASEAILLGTWSAMESGSPSTDTSIVRAAALSLAGREDVTTLSARWSRLVRLRWLVAAPSGWRLGSAGAEALGIGRKTGASRETAEHRALLLEAFRILARRGCRLEILRQGRFDTTLPDARLQLMRALPSRPSPGEIADHVDRARQGWAWRFFHGRNVNVEAEVSGALRPERIRHGCRKATREGAFVLFVVADALRARRIRSVLREMDLGPERAQVWTLSGALRARTPLPERDR